MAKTVSNGNENLFKMPIDQFGRYHIVSSIIKETIALKKSKEVHILDIGGYNGSLYKFFDDKKVHITVLDIFDSDEANYVKGNALNLPFKDNTFDYVVSFEVFEHIPRDNRDKYIDEAIRVSKGLFILTAPFSGEHEETLKSEMLVNNLWKHIHKEDHPWLKEHLLYKTPRAEELEEIISSKGAPFKKIGNNSLLLWNLMQSLSFLTTMFRSSGDNESPQEFYNRNSTLLESGESNFYRYIYAIGEDSRLNLETLRGIKNSKESGDKTHQLINEVFIAISDDIEKLNSTLKKKTLDNEKLTKQLYQANDEINKILNSHSWKLARNISKVSRVVPGTGLVKKRMKK